MKKAYRNPTDESMSEDSSSSDCEYQEKLNKYRQVQGLWNKHQDERQEEDEQPNIMKPKIIQQPPKQSRPLEKGSSRAEEPMTKSAVFPTSRPPTSHSYKPHNRPVVTKRVRLNDPVSRYQQLNNAWRKDSFLEKGANKKEGRKLALSERNRLLGLLF